VPNKRNSFATSFKTAAMFEDPFYYHAPPNPILENGYRFFGSLGSSKIVPSDLLPGFYALLTPGKENPEALPVDQPFRCRTTPMEELPSLYNVFPVEKKSMANLHYQNRLSLLLFLHLTRYWFALSSSVRCVSKS